MGRVRRFLEGAADRIGLVPFNPIVSLWDSARKDERRRRRGQRTDTR